MKKARVKQLRKTADLQGARYEVTHETVWISGKEANLTVCGKSPYDPNQEYGYTFPVYTKVNNFRKLKRTCPTK